MPAQLHDLAAVCDAAAGTTSKLKKQEVLSIYLRGLDESDLQGTCLLVWAIAMIWRMLAPETAEWKTLRP